MSDTAVLPRLISAQELAPQLGISIARLYELCRERRIPHVKLGRSIKFDPQAVAVWIRNGGCSSHEVVA